MARPDFTLKWAGSRMSIPAISAGNYAAGWDTYLGPLPPLGDDHDYVMNLQDSRAIWLGEQMLLAVGHEWQDDVSYDLYAIVRSPANGQLYRSLVGGNLGNEPSASGGQWALGVTDSADLINAPIATVAAAGTINLTTGAPDTSQLAISGTGVNINGFTVAADRFFVVKMTGASNTLVNSASLVTGRGQNISVVAGDTFLMRSTAANTVEIIGFFENPVSSARVGVSANGWVRLESGIIIQWGSASLTSAQLLAISLPITFPNAAFSATCSGSLNGGAIAEQSAQNIVTLTASTITIKNTGNGAPLVRYIAIGW